MTEVERARLSALCDFLSGASISQIARRFRLSPASTEETLRVALHRYGFVTRTPRPQFLRTVGRRRASATRSSR